MSAGGHVLAGDRRRHHGLRAAIVDDGLHIDDLEYRDNPPSIPVEGLVELDATALADNVLNACRTVIGRLDARRHVAAVGITNQRASTIV